MASISSFLLTPVVSRRFRPAWPPSVWSYADAALLALYAYTYTPLLLAIRSLLLSAIHSPLLLAKWTRPPLAVCPILLPTTWTRPNLLDASFFVSTCFKSSFYAWTRSFLLRRVLFFFDALFSFSTRLRMQHCFSGRDRYFSDASADSSVPYGHVLKNSTSLMTRLVDVHAIPYGGFDAQHEEILIIFTRLYLDNYT